MDNAKVPGPLRLDGNISENFRKFKQNFEIYLLAAGLHEKDNKLKTAILLNVIGEDAVELYNTFNLSDGDKSDYEKVIKQFEEYADPKKNIVMERFHFNSRDQQENEPFNNFLTDLRKLVKSCEYKDQTDSLLRDRIVLGVFDKGLQERLLRVQDLTLNNAVDFCRAAELGRNRVEDIANKSKHNVCIVKSSFPSVSSRQQVSSKPFYNNKKTDGEDVQVQKQINVEQKYECRKCSRVHSQRQCPAFGKKCYLCQKFNHFANCCNQRRVNTLFKDNTSGSNVNDARNVRLDNNTFVIDTLVKNNNGNYKEWKEEICIKGQNIMFKIDTGAEINTMPISILSGIMEPTQLSKTEITLKAYGGFKITPMGIVNLDCTMKTGENITLPFVVIDSSKLRENIQPILGLQAAIKLGFLKSIEAIKTDKVQNSKEMFINENKQVFSGTGKCEYFCHIELKDNVTPVVKPPRRIPFAIKDRLKSKLEQLEKDQIISRVDQPKNWVSNLVVIEKSDESLRLCLDPVDLNKAVKREHYIIPTYDDICSKLSNKKFFSVLDMREGFYHIPLDDASSEYCTFNTEFGLYKFNRLPFGLINSAEIFQKVNSQNFGDIPNIVIYIDDILVATETEEEHDRTMKQIVDRALKLNIKFNSDKLQYKVDEVKFFGHVFTAKGVTPDPERVKALLALENPKDKNELQRLMGLFNYLRAFIPDMASITAPLREMLKKDIKFQWLDCHTNVLNKLKNLIGTAPVLANFDETKEISIQCDSSKSGIGCCLMINGQPMSYASRSMSDAEQNFSQIEKEFLAIVYSCKKFHYYIYGRQVKVLTDHKPLVSLMNKHVANIVSPRLQRLKLKVLKYDLLVEYLPGKSMFVADLLSRDYLKDSSDRCDEFVNEVVHCVGLYTNVLISDRKKQLIEVATKEDEILQEVINYMYHGWPKNKNNLSDRARLYYKLKDDLCVENGLLFLNERVVIPTKIRKEILNDLHVGHFGIEKTKSRARQVVYWPGLNNEIENLVSQCLICEKFKPKNVKESLMPHEIPDLPFQKVAVDLFDYAGDSYLVLVDYLSKWLEVRKLRNKQAIEVIKILSTIFATHGIPNFVVADNVPFNSYECSKFANEWNFQFIYSSPRYPKSNGLAERGVQTAKNILKKCKEGGTDLQLALLEFRNLPVYNLHVSPAQILFSRRLRTKIPISETLLIPNVQNNIKSKLNEVISKQKQYYDKNSRDRQSFHANDRVTIRNGNKWEPATILRKHWAPRSYIVENKNGNIVRRNSFDIRKGNVRNNCHFYNRNYDDLQLEGRVGYEGEVNYGNDQNINNNVEQNMGIRRSRYGRVIRNRERLDL